MTKKTKKQKRTNNQTTSAEKQRQSTVLFLIGIYPNEAKEWNLGKRNSRVKFVQFNHAVL